MLLVGWRNQLKTIKTKRLKLKKERQEGEHKKKRQCRGQNNKNRTFLSSQSFLQTLSINSSTHIPAFIRPFWLPADKRNSLLFYVSSSCRAIISPVENTVTCVRHGEDQSLGWFKPRVHIAVLQNNKSIGSLKDSKLPCLF